MPIHKINKYNIFLNIRKYKRKCTSKLKCFKIIQNLDENFIYYIIFNIIIYFIKIFTIHFTKYLQIKLSSDIQETQHFKIQVNYY